MQKIASAFLALNQESRVCRLKARWTSTLGGVRSTCTYVGAAKLKELTKRTTFIRVQEQENNVFGKE